MAREIKKWLKTPASACEVAFWALQVHNSSPSGDRSALIVASVFTAFMAEGVIHCIGQASYQDWEKRQAIARLPWQERHKKVRHWLGLSNSTKDYQSIRSVLEAAFDFRNQLAHPKLLTSCEIGEENTHMLTPIPATHWERHLLEVQATYEVVKEYCQSLLDAAAAKLKEALQEHDLGRSKYPHLKNIEFESALLRGLLHGDAFSRSGP
jgi:hypothetical protein